MSDRLRRFLRGLDDPARRLRGPDPRQQPPWYFPGLTAEPYPSPERFAWVEQLERASEDIRREFASLVRAVKPRHHRPALVEHGAWNTLRLFDRGRPFLPVVDRCPTTSRIVESIPGALTAGLVYFSVLRERTRIQPHFGPVNTRIRCHLALDVPEGRCELTVAGASRRWRRNACLLFDDSFLHEAVNATDHPRVVLLIDVWHPELTATERGTLCDRFDRYGLRDPEAASQPSARPTFSAAGALFSFSAAGVFDVERRPATTTPRAPGSAARSRGGTPRGGRA